MTYPVGTRVLVWRLEEEAQQLLALCREEGIICEDLKTLPVKRQREKAAERLLLCHAFGSPVMLSYTEQGAPSVVGSNVNISITHTQRLVALAIDNGQVIGLDAELKDRPQVLRVRNKFLNDKEKQFISLDDRDAHVIAWTAKEAVIKAERNSAIDWTNGICLEPFVPHPDETTLGACCEDRHYRLTTRFLEDHYITIAAPGAW